MSNFGPAQFGPAVFGGDPVPHLYLQIDAEMTNLARRYTARGLYDGTSLRVTDFSLGEFGFEPLDYLSAIPVNPDVKRTTDLNPIMTKAVAYYEWGAARCPIFYCFVDKDDTNSVIGNRHLGELALWAQIQHSPSGAEDGNTIIYAVAHFPLLVQPVPTATNFIRYAFRVTVQE
jgi:hypothetical protein